MDLMGVLLPSGETPVITVRGLRNQFGEQVIHQDLDLDVRRKRWATRPLSGTSDARGRG